MTFKLQGVGSPVHVARCAAGCNGTLTDPSAIGEVWERPDLGEQVLQHAVLTAMAAALVHDAEQTFREHLSAAIDVVAHDAHSLVADALDALAAHAITKAIASALFARPPCEQRRVIPPGVKRTWTFSRTTSGCFSRFACRPGRDPRSTDEFRRLGRSIRTYAIEPPTGDQP
jgi:hypothetical protein